LLSIEEILEAITFYLSREQEIDAYLADAETNLNQQSRELNAQARNAKPELFDRLEKDAK